MNPTRILSRIELVFWNMTIQALSKSKTARQVIRRVFQFLHDSEAASVGVLLGISGVVGLVSGYLFYFVAASFH